MRYTFLNTAAAACMTASIAFSASIPGAATGKIQLKSAGALAFGNDGVLFIGDSLGGAVVAVDTRDTKASAKGASFDVKGHQWRRPPRCWAPRPIRFSSTM